MNYHTGDLLPHDDEPVLTPTVITPPERLVIRDVPYFLHSKLAENHAHLVTRYRPDADTKRPDTVVKFFRSETSRMATSVGYQTWTQFREVLVKAGFPDILERNEHYQATEFLPGTASNSLVAPLSITEVHSIIHQIAAQILTLMSHKLQHRDVKPANIILNEGRTKATLTDFDIMKAVTPEAGSRAYGTVAFLSPERARGISTLSDDIYALGKTAAWYLAEDGTRLVRGSEAGEYTILQMRAYGYGFTRELFGYLERRHRNVDRGEQTKLQQLMRFMEESDSPTDAERPRTPEMVWGLLDGNPHHF